MDPPAGPVCGDPPTSATSPTTASPVSPRTDSPATPVTPTEDEGTIEIPAYGAYRWRLLPLARSRLAKRDHAPKAPSGGGAGPGAPNSPFWELGELRALGAMRRRKHPAAAKWSDKLTPQD